MGKKVAEVDSKGIKLRGGKQQRVIDMEIRGVERRGLKQEKEK